ncbi:MAG: hypothetical protein KatS3mg031_2537 [Chitinophagales bacterium]|nr:MAG: hypothetical protein KatS3mg031_2537 [Chitinophagales bacterium]
MGIELCRIEDVEIEHPRKRVQHYFPLYAYEDQLSCLQYYVAGNKSNGAFLVPELKAVDYLLLFKGDAAGLAKYDLLHTLEGLPGVQAFFERAPATLRSKQNLLFT